MEQENTQAHEVRWHLDLRHMPVPLRNRIQELAREHRRSVVNEVITLLTAAVNGHLS